jgi:hypothetical protein
MKLLRSDPDLREFSINGKEHCRGRQWHSALTSAREQGGESPLRADALRPVTIDNSAAARRCWEQSKVNDEPIGLRTRFGQTVW